MPLLFERLLLQDLREIVQAFAHKPIDDGSSGMRFRAHARALLRLLPETSALPSQEQKMLLLPCACKVVPKVNRIVPECDFHISPSQPQTG